MAVLNSPTLLWLRRDLRLQDHPALHAAVKRGAPVIPVFIWDESIEARCGQGAATRWWLHHSLAALATALSERQSRLVLARGAALPVLRTLVEETGASAVFWNRCHEPAMRECDAQVATALAAAGVEVRSFCGSVLHEPEAVTNRQGGPFQVFGAFWRHCLSLPVTAPLKLPPGPLTAPTTWPVSAELGDLNLLPKIPWAARFPEHGRPGEAGARERLREFVVDALDAYDVDRDHPGRDGTSRLSAALHFGEISPRQVWAAVKGRSAESGVFPPSNGARVFLSELGWREFAYHVLFHFPRTPETPLRAEFQRFPWADDPGGLRWRSWTRGETGYPIVDAGMRQLWATGWMHNRVRMIVASFLTKHLRLPWSRGAAWFADTLVDADLANNTLGWQWSAGCGADAAPYFRIFSPVLQSRKFDADGRYLRAWVPELAKLPDRYLHAPWEAPAEVLQQAGVRLGTTYPERIVDHAEARRQALAAFETLRGGTKPEPG